MERRRNADVPHVVPWDRTRSERVRNIAQDQDQDQVLNTHLWGGLLAFQESGERKAAIVTYLTRGARDARRFEIDSRKG